MKIERLKIYHPQKDWPNILVRVPVSLVAKAKKEGIGLKLFISNLIIDAVNNNFKLPKK